MSSHGVNVPPGIPAFTLDEVQTAAEQMASADGEVRLARAAYLFKSVRNAHGEACCA